MRPVVMMVMVMVMVVVVVIVVIVVVCVLVWRVRHLSYGMATLGCTSLTQYYPFPLHSFPLSLSSSLDLGFFYNMNRLSSQHCRTNTAKHFLSAQPLCLAQDHCVF